MKVTYDKQQNAYKVIYKDALKELIGERPYTRKQFKSAYKKPTAAERKEEIRKYEIWALEQEELLKAAAEDKKNPTTNTDATVEKEKPILAIEYLENLSGDNLATTKVKQQREEARRCCKDFITFLKQHYQGIYLHQINKKIALEYNNWLDKQGKTFYYRKKRWVRLGFVFNKVVEKQEDSNLKYRNPFWAIKIDKIAEEEPIHHKKTFTPELIRLLLKEAREYSHTKKGQTETHKVQRWAILYLLALTGIRPKDIMLLKWNQINLEARTLTITHYKTAKKGINTVLWLTPHLMELFYMLKELHATNEAVSKEFVFSFHPHRYSNVELERYLYVSNAQSCTNFFKKFREKHNLTEKVELSGKSIYAYCVYSLRATVGTLLTWQNFNQNSIDYLQGHAPNNTTARFYLNHEANPKKATADMVNYLAYRVVQQPLGKVGMKYAMQDYEEEQRELRTQKDISSTIHADNTGNSLIGLMVLEKIDEERRRLEEEKQKLIDQYGEEVANILTQDNSPQ